MFSYNHTEISEILKHTEDKTAAMILGFRTRSQVQAWRERLNVPGKNTQSQIARMHTLDHFFFESIDTEEKAYILGFLAADGNVNPDKYGTEIRVCLHPKDRDILEKINTAWRSTYPIRIHQSTEKSGFAGTCREQPKLSVRSSQMEHDLAKYYIIPAKTATVRFPDIPIHLHRHYLRGLLDGDGYVNHEAFGWVGNATMLNDIMGVFLFHGFPELKQYHVRNTSYMVKGGPFYLELVKWMYEDASIFLDRKKQQFDQFWKDRVYRKPTRSSFPNTKHIPCALESLPSYLKQDSMT